MALATYLTSLHGRLLGLTRLNELYSSIRDQVMTGLTYSNQAPSTAITATSTETAFSTKWTMPANYVRPGSVIKIKFQGIATATNSTDTLTIKLYLGGLAGTALLTLAARDVANNDIFSGEFDVIIRTVGSTGTFVGTGMQTASPNAAGTAVLSAFLGSTAIDTTTSKDVVVSATWSTTNAGNSCRLDLLTVEVS